MVSSCLQVTRLHFEHLEDIRNLKNYILTIGDKKIHVKFDVICSMHDGKEVGIISKEILK